MSRLILISLVVGFLPGIIDIVMTMGYRMDAVSLGTVFGSLKWLAPALMIGTVILLLTGIMGLLRGEVLLGGVAIVAALASAGMAYGPVKMKQIGGTVPPIHDITTDTVNPPQFLVTAKLRKEGENPAAYDGNQSAPQIEAYPDLGPIVVSVNSSAAFDACVAAMNKLGIVIVSKDKSTGRIEGTATSRWYGFKDDVVFRVTTGEGGEAAVIDIRSKSRVGRSDLGANAARIRALRTEILKSIPAV